MNIASSPHPGAAASPPHTDVAAVEASTGSIDAPSHMDTAPAERRRSVRLPVRLSVEMRRTRWESWRTEDISRRGIFLRGVEPLPPGQLVQLRVSGPVVTSSIEMLGRVARVVAPPDALAAARLPGVGIEFFCLRDRALEEWDGLVRRVSRLIDANPAMPPFVLTEALANLTARPGARILDRSAGDGLNNVVVRLEGRDQIDALLARAAGDVRAGLRIPGRDAGRGRVRLRLVHPTTEEELVLEAELLPVGERDSLVRLTGLEPSLEAAIRHFLLDGGLGPLDDAGSSEVAA